MNDRCFYCQSPLSPGEHQCQECGRWQPPSTTRYQPPDDPFDNPWEDEDPDWGAPGGPTQQGTFRRGAPLGPSAHQRRLPSHLTQPPFHQNGQGLKILIVVLAVAVIGLGGGAIAVVLANGGTSSPGTQAAASAGQTATPSSTAQATATSSTVTQTPAPGQTPTTASNGDTCPASGGLLTFTNPPGTPFVYEQLLPDDLPHQPVSADEVHLLGPILTSNEMGLAVSIKRPSGSQILTICKISLQLIAFTPLSGAGPNVLQGCAGVYLNPGGPQGGGCGGGYGSDATVPFAFTTPQVGTTITLPVTGSDGHSPLRVTSTSEGTITADTHFTVPGTYTFKVGLWNDTTGPKFNNQAIERMILLGHMNSYWGSDQCTTPEMQAMLPPPSDPPGQFICPGNPPA